MPTATAFTFTEMEQEELTGRVTPLTEREVLPAAAVKVPAPQVLLNPLGVAMTRPLGNESVKPTLLKEPAVLGLTRLKDSDVVPPNGMLVAPKASASVAGVSRGWFTVTLAVACANAPSGSVTVKITEVVPIG